MRQEGGCAERSMKDRDFGNRYDEFSTPFPDPSKLSHYLGLEIPWQNQDVVRSGFPEFLGRKYRNMRPGQKFAVFVGTSIHGEIEKVGTDTAIVEQRVALAGCTVRDDSLSLALCLNEELEQLALGLSH